MNDAPHPALLPAGLYDLLPPEAEIEAAVTARLMGVLAAHGYERVKPRLVEFEETLLSGAGAAMASDTFRTMDPISHHMIGVRADMTPQVARIAATRLSHKPRPLRLSYAGQVLRVKGSEMRPERQVGQAGAELIGAGAPGARPAGRCPRRTGGGDPGAQGHRRPGRESRLRIPHRHQLYLFRAGRAGARAVGRARPRRPLSSRGAGSA